MKNHLKRIAAPKSWLINRKSSTFIVRPNPGAHALDKGLPLGVIIRDNLKLAQSMVEVKRLLNNNEVLIDGRRRKDHRMITGLFDVISIPKMKKFYRVELDNKGRLNIVELSEEQSRSKLCKVVGKKLLKKGVIQLGLHDGKTLAGLTSGGRGLSVGDSVIIELPSLKITKTFSLKPGAKVLLTSGKHGGISCELEQITSDKVVCQAGREQIETAKSYLFVVG